MRKDVSQHARFCQFLCAFLFACLFSAHAGKEPKMKVEELVARHLDSIGTPEARAAAKNRVASGTAQVIFRMPASGRLDGSGSFLSDGRLISISLMFASADYQGEHLVFDGKSVDVGQLQLRVRSHLSDFVYHYGVLLKEGLVGGAITTAWPLLDLAGRQPGLGYSGLKKVDGKPLHELKYRARRDAGDVQVALFFDPETFQHVYSEYRLVVRASMVQDTNLGGKSAADTSSQNDVYYKIQEWFGDFRVVDSLTLPHSYKLAFSRQGPSQAVIFEYNVALTRVLHNQEMEPRAFTIQ